MIFLGETKGHYLKCQPAVGMVGKADAIIQKAYLFLFHSSVPEGRKIIIQHSFLQHCIKSEIRKYCFIIIVRIKNSNNQNDFKVLFYFPYFLSLLLPLLSKFYNNQHHELYQLCLFPLPPQVYNFVFSGRFISEGREIQYVGI